jgi:hypothetical protein
LATAAVDPFSWLITRKMLLGLEVRTEGAGRVNGEGVVAGKRAVGGRVAGGIGSDGGDPGGLA